MTCRSQGEGVPAGRLRARIVGVRHDTLAIQAPASAGRCRSSRLAGLLLTGTDRANGVLILLRVGDSLAADQVPLLARGDSTSERGAIVTARYAVGEETRGVTLDSGTVTVTRARDELTVTTRGSGAAIGGAGRVRLDATFESVRIGPDTVPCEMRP